MATQSDVGRQGKTVLVVGALAVLGLAYVILTYAAAPSKAQSSVAPVQAAQRPKEVPETEAYAKVLERYNNQKAQDAQNTGQSYLSVLSARTEPVEEKQQAAVSPPPAPPQVVYYQQAPDAAVDPDRQRQFDNQTRALIATWVAVPHSQAAVAADAAAYAKSLRRQTEVIPEPTPADRISTAATRKVVDDFQLVPAILETDIDTDENSMVAAYIPGGEYAGARVYASNGYKRVTNTVDITFDYMKFRGRSYKVKAKAVDQTTNRTALSGEVNNRFFTRILMPALAGGIGRTGQLYEQASATQTITPLGGVINTFPRSPNTGAIAGTVVGGIGTQAGQVLASDAATVPVKQVLIAKGKTIGVQFIGPVLESDDVALGADSVPSDSSPARE